MVALQQNLNSSLDSLVRVVNNLSQLSGGNEHRFLSFEYVFGGSCILIVAVVAFLVKYWIDNNRKAFDDLTNTVKSNTEALITLNTSYIKQETQFNDFINLYNVRHDDLIKDNDIFSRKVQYLEDTQKIHGVNIEKHSGQIRTIEEKCSILHKK